MSTVACPACGSTSWVRRESMTRVRETSLHQGEQLLSYRDPGQDEIERSEGWFCGVCRRPAGAAAGDLDALLAAAAPIGAAGWPVVDF